MMTKTLDDIANRGFDSKNLPKLIFSFFFLMVNMALFFFSAFQFYYDSKIEWLGPVIGESAFMWTMGYIFFSARTSRYLPILSTLIVTSLILSIYASGGNSVPVLVSVYLLITWVLYIFWYSNFTVYEREELAVGQQMPDFELKDNLGEVVKSQDFLGKKSLFLFYRGNWCPLCMAQIKEIAHQYKELCDKGVVVNLVSTQPEKFTQQLAKKFDVPFNYLIDEDGKVALKLRIHQKNIVPLGMQVLGHSLDGVTPTIIITNENGQIIFSEIADNYRIRPEPEVFLRVIDEYEAGSIS